jgi:hypothetical protein
VVSSSTLKVEAAGPSETLAVSICLPVSHVTEGRQNLKSLSVPLLQTVSAHARVRQQRLHPTDRLWTSLPSLEFRLHSAILSSTAILFFTDVLVGMSLLFVP